MAFSPDSSRFIFHSKRSAERNAPWDMFRANADGSGLVQLTDCDGLGHGVMSIDGTRAFFSCRNQIRSVDLETFEETTLAEFDGKSVGQLTVGGDYVFAKVNERSDKGFLFRLQHGWLRPPRAEGGDRFQTTSWPARTGNYLGWIKNDEINEYDTQTFYVMKSDGTGNRKWAIHNWSHSGWVGTTDRMQGLPAEARARHRVGLTRRGHSAGHCLRHLLPALLGQREQRVDSR